MAITLRNTKGSPLTFTEHDTNFTDLQNLASGVHTGLIPSARLALGTAENFLRGDGTASNTLTKNLAGTYDALVMTNSDTGGSSNVRLRWTHGSGTNAVFSLTSGGLTCVGTNFTFGTTAAEQSVWSTNGANRVVVGSAGNVTVNAPSSGVALGVTASAGNSGITVSGASTSAILSLSNTTSGNAYTDYLASGVREYLVGTHRSTDEFRIVSGANFDSGVQFAITNASKYKFQGAAATAFIPGSTSFAIRNNADSADNLLIADGGSATFRASAATTPFNIGNSGTAFTCTLTNSNVQTVTMTGNVSGANFTLASPVDGQTLNLFITQDATGNRTLGYPTSVKWPGGTAGVLSTAANAVDLLTLTYRSATGFYYATLLKGFA